MCNKTNYLFLLSKVQKLEALAEKAENGEHLHVFSSDHFPHISDIESLYLDEKGNLVRFIENAKIFTHDEYLELQKDNEILFSESLDEDNFYDRIKDIKKEMQPYIDKVMFDVN